MMCKTSENRTMRWKAKRLNSPAFAILFSLAAIICHAQAGWTSKRIGSGGKDLNAVYFTDAKHGWVGGDGGFLSHTEDGGANWFERPIGTNRAINDIYFANQDIGFVVTGGSIFSTSDAGHLWRETRTFASSEFGGATPELYSLRFKDKKHGWVVGSVSRSDRVTGSILAMTTDGGRSWNVLQAPTGSELIHIDFVDDKRGWIVGAAGTILHTKDAGETWIRQDSGTTNTLYHVDFRNERLGWAVGERGTILRTIDGGLTWAKVDSEVRSTLLSVQFVTSDDGWIVGRGGVILRSGDGGRTWIDQQIPTKQNLYALFMTKKNGWAVGSDGLILRYER
jgi:photosystem II stability/assembly factor-like uncharacterized protein